jgi:hypothetical protein
MPAHTLGPWHVEGEFDAEAEITIMSVHGYTICEISPAVGDWEPDEIANAHLFAAAPELLEACQITLRQIDQGGIHSKIEKDGSYTSAETMLRRAIAKAEGRA